MFGHLPGRGKANAGTRSGEPAKVFGGCTLRRDCAPAGGFMLKQEAEYLHASLVSTAKIVGLRSINFHLFFRYHQRRYEPQPPPRSIYINTELTVFFDDPFKPHIIRAVRFSVWIVRCLRIFGYP